MKVTVTVWAGPPALIVKEVGLMLNCPASVPDTVMLETVSAAVPVLDTVKVCVPEEPTPTLPDDNEEDDWL
ncbi:MAG: hypothetical protein A3F84_19520 [Candidatus Handelsmanbacteria bacterium RIFCSPLOWO2_12_FULL_64_10]|uniref:Uncharacterized protein n=1 Tax=Handelsmanbacteria sp. (strain RIFCSPLOWO2_12_FULL_64_10) TaxID=1817868 RepID=A0A1F6CBS2_HANXR|nr:MAG: hypothetical protein A3F84_19520 [Candidatus Handelsmanbacteria bacterium RIFCSPLOWO2_12_FULL_64_10]